MPTLGLANDIEGKFQSAVELVRSLPQKGPFQPSYNDASKVYGYYKQAKFGPCSNSRPAFWDVVGRAKWDAWSMLGDMPKHEAMENYVNEIKKFFERLTTMDEFVESQSSFSHVIIPFCEANGIKVPSAIAEDARVEKKKKEKKKMDEAVKKSNGLANGHTKQVKDRSNDILVEIKGDSVQLVTGKVQDIIKDEVLNENGINVDENASNDSKFGAAENIVSVESTNDEERDLSPQAVTMEVSSYVDAESSDDDVYCDSINPDEISFTTQNDTIKSEEMASVVNDSANVADNTSLLLADSHFMEGDNGLVAKPINSTPVVKVRPRGVSDLDNNSSSSLRENNTDLSTLSSMSCELNGTQEVSVAKGNVCTLEDELKNEFESKLPRHSRRSRIRKHDPLGKGRKEREQSDILGKRELVVGARGNSQTDLAGSGRASTERQEGVNVAQHEAEPSRRTAGLPSQRRRRTNAGSSSDSNQSTGSSVASGETIGEQIVKALGRLEHDMRLVLGRLDSIEGRISAVSDAVNRRPWWVAYVPSRRYMFLLLWPILIHFLCAFWRRRRRK